MKRKPILVHKLAAESTRQGREVIGLIGTHHGAGVTYTGLMLAFYMGEERGRNTAYLELNDHHDMMLIQNAYEWSRQDELSFSFHRITCCREVAKGRISEIFSEDYDCIILDCGIDFAANREEFLRCGIKIVVGGRSEWELPKLKRFSEYTNTIHGSESWLYFIPLADNKAVVRTSNEIIQKVYSVPMVQEPTMPSNISNRFFDKILQL